MDNIQSDNSSLQDEAATAISLPREDSREAMKFPD